MLLGMGGIGQYLVVASMDVNVYCCLFLCHFYLIFMLVLSGVLWTYVQRFYGRTSLVGQDVRPKDAWTYVHRSTERR